jgi:hypothetical protein
VSTVLDYKSPRQRLSFAQWRGAVNAYVVRRVGLDCDDLPDWRYRDAYDDGMSPSRAASQVVKNAKES